MRSRLGAIALVLMGVVSAPVLPASAQPYGYDDRPPPPDDGYRRPPPPDDDGYRRPPPDSDDGYRRRPPPPRFSDDDDDRPLICRTPEGSCRGRGPRFYRARCFCDFGDGPVRGRMR